MKIQIIPFFILLLISCSSVPQANTHNKGIQKKSKEIQNIAYDTVYIDSDFVILKNNFNFLLKQHDGVIEFSPNFIFHASLISDTISLNVNGFSFKGKYESVSLEYDHILTLQLKQGDYTWKGYDLSVKNRSGDFHLKDYCWAPHDTLTKQEILLANIVLKKKDLVYGRNFFTVHQIEKISDENFSFFEGTYIYCAHKNCKNFTHKENLRLSDVVLRNDYYNDMKNPGNHRYFGFVVR